MTAANPTRQPGEAVAWASEWMGFAPSRGLHDSEQDASDNAEWMEGIVVPLIPASGLTQVTHEPAETRDENARWLSRFSAIREASGVGAGPMLAELPEAIAAGRRERDDAVGNATIDTKHDNGGINLNLDMTGGDWCEQTWTAIAYFEKHRVPEINYMVTSTIDVNGALVLMWLPVARTEDLP